MDPQQTPRPPVQKPPTAYPQAPIQRFPSPNNGAVNGPRPQHPEDKSLNPNPQQQIQPRSGPAPQAGGPIRPAGAPLPRNVFALQRPPGPRAGPPGTPYPAPASGPRFPPPNPGIREAGPQGPPNVPSSVTPGPGFPPNSSQFPGPQRPPYPGQAPERPRAPLTRNPSLSQEDHNFSPRPPNAAPQNRLQRNDSTSSVNEQRVFGNRPPRNLIDRTMSESEDQNSRPGTPKSTVPPRLENENLSKEKMEPKVVQNRPSIEPDKPKMVGPQDENVSEVKKLEQDSKSGLKNLVKTDSLEGVKGFDNGKERALSAKLVVKDENVRNVNTAKITDGSKTPDQEKKKAHFSEDIVEMKDKSKPDRKTWSNTERSPRKTTRDRELTLSLKSGDAENDSGVDESTQRKEGPMTNGVSPNKKLPIKLKEDDKRSTTASPVKSPSKSTKSLPRTPDSTSSNNLQEVKKKLPMNKVQVGAAPSPNLKAVKSKIGSMDNATYKPGGGKVKIENRKLDFSKAQPKITAKNDKYAPSGGDKKIQQVKLQWNAKPKVGSLDNATYKPGGGDKKIESVKLDFKDKAKPKVGSKENAKHVPGGGSVKSPTSQPKTPLESPKHIETQKIDIKAESKIGSLDNVKHKPGGGDKKIFNDKDYLKQTSSSNAESVSGSGKQVHRLASIAEEQRKLKDRPEPQPPPSTPTRVRTPTSISYSDVTPRAVRSGLIGSPDRTSKRFTAEELSASKKLKGSSPTKEESPRPPSRDFEKRKSPTPFR